MKARLRAVAGLLAGRLQRPDIAIAHHFRKPPYGGSNQFLLALASELRRNGLRIGENVGYAGTRGVIINSFLFDERRLEATARGGARVLHRVDGPVSVYRGVDDGTDGCVVDVNRRYADVTVFQSQYSLEKSRSIGIELINPIVISNAVDPAIFHPPARASAPGDLIRIIATAWSDHPNKGAELYAWLDEHLDRSRFAFTFVGRLPRELRHATVVPPVGSHGVAELLRGHDVYLTASKHEACSNALIEALACGLPAVYIDSGSNPELVGAAGVAFHDEDDVLLAIDRVAADLQRYRSEIALPSLPETAARYLDALGIPVRL